MNKPIFSPAESGRLVYLPFILLLAFGSLASTVSGMQTHVLQDSIRQLLRLPEPPVPPRAPVHALPVLPAPPAVHRSRPAVQPLPPGAPVMGVPEPPLPPSAPVFPRP